MREEFERKFLAEREAERTKKNRHWIEKSKLKGSHDPNNPYVHN